MRTENNLTSEMALENFAESGRKRILFYYSYSYIHKDIMLKNELAIRLETLKQQELLDPWCVDNFLPGSNRESLAQDWLSKAEIISPLLSPDFIANDALMNQINNSIERQKTGDARVIPIIIRPIDLPVELKGLECLPTEKLAVSKWADRDLAWQNVYCGLTKAALEIRFPFNEFRFSIGSERFTKAILVLSIDPARVNKDLLIEILNNINAIAVGFHVELYKVLAGSTVLLLKGSREEINRLYFEFRYNGFNKICGIAIDNYIPFPDNNTLSKIIDLSAEEHGLIDEIGDEKLKLKLRTIILNNKMDYLSQTNSLYRQVELSNNPDIRKRHILAAETICDDLDKMVQASVKLGFAVEERTYIRTRFRDKLSYNNMRVCIRLENFDIGIISTEEGHFSLLSDWDAVRSATGRTGSEIADQISREFSYEKVISHFNSKGFSLDSEIREADEIRLIGVSWSTGRRKVLEALIDKKGLISYKEGADSLEEDSDFNVLKIKT